MEIKIGNTPMIEIKYNYNGKLNNIFAKLEYYNYTGSIKDRVAFYIIKEAIKNGSLKRNMTIYEATSGNTGISLAALGTLMGFKVKIFMPDWVSEERVKIMQMYGAEVRLISRKEGGFLEAIRLAKEESIKSNGFFANQFENNDNILAHYETTGLEILNQVDNIGAFISGIGTGGTLIGVGKRLKKYDKKIKIIALEPDKMPLLSKNEIISNHKIEGIGDEFIPSIVDKRIIDKVILINDDDAINMAKLLSRKLGLGVGISSGANFLASVIFKDKIEKNVVTVFADDNKKYLSTDLSKEIDNNPEFISNKIELLRT